MKALAVVPQGLENLAAEEIKLLGGTEVEPLKRSVSFNADLPCFYRIHLQSRLPFRILREISRFKCQSRSELYAKIQHAINWEKWLNPSLSFKVDVSGHSNYLTHSHYTALEVKNAIVDLQRHLWGERSKIELDNPDLCLHLHLTNDIAILSLDGSGKSLHRRGYRPAMGSAPIKENLAAGLIKLTGWNQSSPLIDPMCGSGTLLIEAASIALKLAPGIYRSYILENWKDFNLKLWKEELKIAFEKQDFNGHIGKLIGCEKNSDIALQAQKNIQVAGLENYIEIKNLPFSDLKIPNKKGVVICNPPYGKRIGREDDLSTLYTNLGNFLKKNASGWEFWILSGNPSLTKSLKMKCSQRIPINNGGLDCRWLKYTIN